MKKKKALPSFLYLVFIVLLPWGVSFSFNKCLELWIKNWWNTGQSETLLTDIQEKRVLERFMELEDLFILDEMIKEKPKTHVQNPPIGIHKEIIQLAKIDNEDHLNIILHFSTNIICLAILSGSFFLGKEELVILNSWVQEFLYNLNDPIKAFFILLITDFFVGFHSTRGWELIIRWVYNDLGWVPNKLIFAIFVSCFPVILDTCFKFWIFFYLSRLSPSLVVIYHSIMEA
uniref:Potassium/proton antiporter CemA n=1 Tax=Zizania latifolia TaxID=58934 RepID=A0A0Y0HSE3_9ORYZ|nr:chloroplast envelope membrane protein [Zizania latifolia]AIZ76909.1 chloroplast envelope membrane protein [Zizania latifolia]AMB27151.1 chloroplast envelope membrane protein [Zizania latifolia]UVI16758.1 chloroplast envelope membrane protein [Zizania latifolia]UVI16844.1 chloroplast envelope membrane protein [Zizania latifolia]UVI16930.1 chloroplast envelope membrane protein [Zizania latifolia]